MNKRRVFYASLATLMMVSCAPKHYQLTNVERTRVIVDSRFDNNPDEAAVKFLEPYKGLCHTFLISPLRYLGVLSSMIFVVHSIPRMPIYVLVLKTHSGLMLVDYAWLALYVVLTLALAWLYKWIMGISTMAKPSYRKR